MKHKIEQYIQKVENQIIIDKGIIGKTIQANDGDKAQVLSVGCDASGEYITVKGIERGYKIPKPLFKHFKLID
ncbi:MAG: hypothetical protein MUP55_02000 [Candidatus Aenigmarchaeota archaeon]|nr:hypothetical protein [Candidatus Aenigmarchaeota archaeon]